MDIAVETTGAELPAIPHLDVSNGGVSALVHGAPDRFAAMLDAGRRHYGALAMSLGNGVSRRWLERNANPYLGEINALAALTDEPGVHLLNLSYEWTCTSAAGADPAGTGARMLRTLDWPLHGLGRNVLVGRMSGPAGTYENVTWPGFSGIATAMAAGRFAAAINQPPMRKWTTSCWFDWGVNRWNLWRRRALPPVHLLRRVFDHCRDYAEARDVLLREPIAMPAFFTLVGTEPDQGCVIERTEDGAIERPAPVSVANHWVATDVPGRYRGFDSPGRFALMETERDRAGADRPFDWIKPPILNPTTRLAVLANPAIGRLVVQGWEEDGPATAVLELT
jgi:hypothetical protein